MALKNFFLSYIISHLDLSMAKSHCEYHLGHRKTYGLDFNLTVIKIKNRGYNSAVEPLTAKLRVQLTTSTFRGKL